jgi:hypothetical protein
MKTKKERKLDEAAVARVLGASRVARVAERKPYGPLEWMGMARSLQDRLVSRGGRPSDPRWDTKRLVPFRRRTWQRLAKRAHALSVHGKKVGPAQLAAILIERNL